jgi:phosphoribosyl-dephospho-CoA transferase
MKTPSPRVHDLLEVDGRFLVASLGSMPVWLENRLGESFYVVARRPAITENQIPVGICGKHRNQRFATSIPRKVVRRIVTPPQLLRLADGLSITHLPALRSLVSLRKRWTGLGFPWGPIGSVALELATGSDRVNALSDLDIVLHAADRFTRCDAKAIFASTLGLPARVDILVETPVCGFSLFEFGWARSGNILLRTQEGPVLGNDPWNRVLSSRAETAPSKTVPS